MSTVFRRRKRGRPASEMPDDPGLPVDTESLDFKRGVEFGLLFARVKDYGHDSALVHADMAELIMRLAESRGLSFRARPHEHDERCAENAGRSDCEDGEDWLHVTISSAPL